MNLQRIFSGGCAVFLSVGLSSCGDNGIYNVAPPPKPSILGPAMAARDSEVSAAVNAAAEQAAVEARASAAMTGANGTAVASAGATETQAGPIVLSSSPPVSTQTSFMAYSYEASLVVPNDKVVVAMVVHRKKCENAGVNVCQIIQASSRVYHKDSASAELEIRATPTWLARFRDGLEADAKASDGKIGSQTVTGVDLTRSITDTEARLRALKSLRTRLEQLIASRPGKLADLLEAERELSRVQGEIDSFENTLSIMRAQVNMSTMDLKYETKESAVGGDTFAPVSDALTGFFSVLAQSLSILIGLVAALIPFALILGPLGYYGFKWRAKLVARAKAAKAQSAP